MAAKVLIVDDDADVRRTLRLVLEDCGVEIAEAASGEEALRLCVSANPALVLLDLSMPGMSGLETLSALRAKSPALSIIMLTSSTDIVTAKMALDLGASLYMTKPYDTDALKREVMRALKFEPPSAMPWKVKD